MNKGTKKLLKEDWVAKGEGHLAKNELDKALFSFQQAIAIDAQYHKAWVLKSTAHFKQGKFEHALTCINEALAIEAKSKSAASWMHYSTWMEKGSILVRLNNPQEAISCFDRANQDHPNNAYSWQYKGEALFTQAQYDGALECFDTALKLNPKLPIPWYIKGDIFFNRGQYTAAIECLNEAIRHNSNNHEFWNLKGQVLEQQGKLGESLKHFKKAIELVPEHEWSLACMAQVLVKQGQHLSALETYNKILKINPNAIFTLGNKVQLLVHMGRYQEALECCEVSLRNKAGEGHYQDGWALKGFILCIEGKYREALECFERSQKFKKISWPLAYKGIVYFCMNDLENSVACFQEALRLGEHKYYAIMGLGIYEFMKGNSDAASQLLSQADTLLASERDIMAIKDYWFCKGVLFGTIKAYPEANAAFETLLSLDPNHVPAKVQLAALQAVNARQEEAELQRAPDLLTQEEWMAKAIECLDQKHDDKALECCDKAIANYPNDPQSWGAKIEILWELARDEETLEACDAALSVDATNLVALVFKLNAQSKLNIKDKSLLIRAEYHPLALAFKADGLVRQGKFAEAVKMYQFALTDGQYTTKTFTRPQKVYWSEEKYEEIKNHCEQVLAIDPENEPAWACKATVLHEQGNDHDALSCYESALALNPQDLRAQMSKKKILLKQGRYQEARALEEEFFPNPLRKHRDLIAQGNYEEACQLSDETKSIPPEHLQGVAYVVQGNFVEALHCFERLPKPHGSATLSYQGIALFCRHDLENSRVCFQKAMTEFGDVPLAMLGFAVCEFHQGNRERAVSLFKKAEWLLEQSGSLEAIQEYWYLRGQLFLAIQDYSEAKSAFEKVLLMDPNYVPAQTQLTMIPKLTLFTNIPERLKSHRLYLIESERVKVDEGAVLGKGGFGVVYKASLEISGVASMDVAVKRLITAEMTEHNWESFLREVESQTLLKSPGVVELLGITDKAPYCMVMKLMQKGSLRHVLARKARENLSWKKRLRMGANVAEGLAYLHERHVVHRDIKTDNILVDEYGSAKLSDLGLIALAKKDQDGGVIKEEHEVGTERWLAPESIKNKEYTVKTDIYSFALVLWSMWSHDEPFTTAFSALLCKQNVLKGVRPVFDDSLQGTPPAYIRLVISAWDPLSCNRPTAAEIAETLKSLLGLFSAKKKPVLNRAVKPTAPLLTNTSKGQPIQPGISRSSGLRALPPIPPKKPSTQSSVGASPASPLQKLTSSSSTKPKTDGYQSNSIGPPVKSSPRLGFLAKKSVESGPNPKRYQANTIGTHTHQSGNSGEEVPADSFKNEK